MWEEQLKIIIEEKELYDEKINEGISESEKRDFLEKVNEELQVILPKEYIALLNKVNGIEFNGYIIYGVDEYLLDTNPNQYVNGFIENNLIWYENEWQRKYIFIGESNFCWYVYGIESKRYFELDNPSGSELEEFEDFESLIDKILEESVL